MASPPRAPSLHEFLDELLAEQQRLQTPIARFGALDRSDFGIPHSAVHTDLIPLSAPVPGEQYAFEVDLDACSGCKACVAGCHSLNGLDEEETWREVGLVLGGDAAYPFQQTITSACHHCEDPGCMNGCPVLAYEKDPVTGIVRHLDDQCIGCSYCILKCPYDVPKFSKRLGIVRKCDMCHGRLAAGEAPACVQACPTHAIKITKVTASLGREASPRPPFARATDASNADALARHPRPQPTFLPVFPDPAITRPTTRYVSRRPLPANLRAADADTLRPQPPHWPLVVMLVLTQVSIGALLSHLVAARPDALRYAAICGLFGIAASVAHLGQPLRAWRVFLGLRRSWLSREAVLFGAYLPALLVAAAASLLAVDYRFLTLAAPVAGTIGAASVFCSMMIYIDTRRRFWRAPLTALRMGGTVAVFALGFSLPLAAALVLAAKLGGEALSFIGRSPSARLQRGPLRSATALRLTLGAMAVVGLVFAPTLGLGLALAGELAERYLYFRAVDAPKMPGVSTNSVLN
ncbi:MAG: dimethyl sulfoxide reductase anchor subunit [Opitutaceae bacterium]|nr:dimethyl sulfoxide reductase anchor subunit [Opitutaceae bacterium]